LYLTAEKQKGTMLSLDEKHSHKVLFYKVQWEAFLWMKKHSHWWNKHQGSSSRSLGKQPSSQPAEKTLARGKRNKIITGSHSCRKQHDVVGVAFASSEWVCPISFQCGFPPDVYFTLKKENQGLEVFKAVNHLN